jgi:glycosyltransferase involved in cell wall biosynthesis
MITGRDIVCASFGNWGDMSETPHHLMTRLARENRVLFVNQPVSPLSFASRMVKPREFAGRLTSWRHGARSVGTNIWEATPPPIIPRRTNKLVSSINAAYVRRWVVRQARALGFREAIYWNFQPWMPGLGRALNPAVSVYYCVDDFASAPYWWNPGASVRAREEECCREADLVVCTGRQLVEKKRPFNPNVAFMPEGADVDAYIDATRDATPVPDDLSRLPGKVIGYVGAINWRLDSRIILHMAEREPGWSFVLIGPVWGDLPDAERLRAASNVYFLGPKPASALPSYCKGMDVCLIPYVLNEYTHHIFPLKLYEYMAAGKPMVSTDMAEMRPYEGENLAIGRSPEEFHTAVRRALEEDSEQRATERQTSARNESWDARVEQLSELVAPFLRARSPNGPRDAGSAARMESAS